MQKIKAFLFRVLRFIGAIAIIYVSMVLYMALTEKQKAFPRAITHKEATEALKDIASPLTCTLEDGIVLNGWAIGSDSLPTLLYYPDAEEDAAQFLAEIENIEGYQLVSFNYRGGGQNKGNPSQENFSTDAAQIYQCATQTNNQPPAFVIGRGTGAILAFEQSKHAKPIYIDPIFSIADAISYKYRVLYPKFLIRTSVAVTKEQAQNTKQPPAIIFDKKLFEQRNIQNIEIFSGKKILIRDGKKLHDTLLEAIHSQR
ncbi:MAG: alpha/beta hydrolase [Fibrobacter sp.]|nr:alpha/beta hydrolase [Fibrobacter sp.]